MTPVRVLLADDHQVVRQGLRALLQTQAGIEVVGEAGDGLEAVDQAQTLRPDVVVMDIAMPLLNGIEATQQIADKVPGARVVILSMYHTKQYVFRALRAGAAGYVLKQNSSAELLLAIEAVSRGESFLSPSVSREVIDEYLQRAKGDEALSEYDRLSAREREILQLTAEGRGTKEIARLLRVSPRTIETHRANLMNKLNIHHTAGLVRFAVRVGLVPPEG